MYNIINFLTLTLPPILNELSPSILCPDSFPLYCFFILLGFLVILSLTLLGIAITFSTELAGSYHCQPSVQPIRLPLAAFCSVSHANTLLAFSSGQFSQLGTLGSQVSGCLLQTAQTWANAGVCSASCAHAFGCMYVCLFVCLFVITCLFVLQAI